MKKFLSDNKYFLIPYLLFLIAGGVLIALYEKGDDTLYVNQLHTNTLNHFFIWATQLGELPVAILVLLFIAYSNYGQGLLFGINLVTVFSVIQFLKKIVFATQDRPSVFFENTHKLDYIAGVEMLRHHSFPSGHSAGAFAIFFMLSVIIKDKRWGALLFVIALLVGISRVYLLQHFFRDIYVGSFIAVCITTIFCLTFTKSKFYQGLSWKDNGLYTLPSAIRQRNKKK